MCQKRCTKSGIFLIFAVGKSNRERREAQLPFFIRVNLMGLKEHIAQWMESRLSNTPYFLVGIKASSNLSKLSVLLDGDTGMDIDTCATISRELSEYLDEKDLVPGQLILEVSSPGADQPLVMPRQFPKHSGRTLSVQLDEGVRLEGVLKDVQPEFFVLAETKGKGKKQEITEHTLRFDEIREARVLIRFK